MPGVWDAFWKSNAQSQNRPKRNQIILETLHPQDLAGKIIADVGCGKAEGTLAFAKARNARLELVDDSDDQLKRTLAVAQERGIRARMHLMNATELKLNPQSVDLVHSEGLVEHFTAKERSDIFQNIHRALKPGGKVIITIPNGGSIPFRINKKLLEWMDRWPYGTMEHLSLSDIRREMEANGFIVERTAGLMAFSSHVLGPFFLVSQIRNVIQRILKPLDYDATHWFNRHFGIDIAVLASKRHEPRRIK